MNKAVPPSQTAEQPEKKQEALVPGARILSSLLFVLFGGVFLWQSILLYKKDSSITGAAMFPLAISILLLILTVIDFAQKMRVPSELDALGVKDKIIQTILYLFPKDSLVFLLFSIAFYVAMVFGVPFLIAATVFLLASMCYLIPHEIKKNLIFTVIIIAVIYLIFTVVFKVSLP